MTATLNVPAKPGIHLYALKGQQAERQMYLLLVTNHELLRNFAAEAEISDGTERVQRDLDSRHARDIVNYIVDNPTEYLLGAMTYAIDTVSEQDFTAAAPGSNIGTLVLPTNARLRCLDGQHRRHAIAEAVRLDESVGDDYSAVVLYVEDDFMKRRQMFSDMNATPKVVSKALNITFDSRDPYARAAQKLAADHDLLRGVVETRKARISTTDPKIFSLAGVFDALKRFDLGMTLPRGRSPKGKTEEELVAIGTRLFDVIREAFPQFQAVKDQLAELDDPTDQAAAMKAARRSTILFSTTTLRVIAGALHEAMKADGETEVEKYVQSLSKVDFAPSSLLFTADDVNFVSGTGTPSARNQEVFAATRALSNTIRLH